MEMLPRKAGNKEKKTTLARGSVKANTVWKQNKQENKSIIRLDIWHRAPVSTTKKKVQEKR